MSTVKVSCINGTSSKFISELTDKIAIVSIPDLCLHVEDLYEVTRQEVKVVEELDEIHALISDESEIESVLELIEQSILADATIEIDSNFSVRVNRTSINVQMYNNTEYNITDLRNNVFKTELFSDDFNKVYHTGTLIFSIDNVSTISISEEQFDSWINQMNEMFIEHKYFNPPQITFNPATLAFTNTTAGSTSAEQYYEVNTRYIDHLDITAPDGFLISKDSGGPYSTNIYFPLDEDNESINSMIYTIFSPILVQAYNDNIVHETTEIADELFNVTGLGVV